MNNKIKSYIAIILSCIFWGFSFISTKLCLGWLTPIGLALFRGSMASVILLIVLLIKEKNLKVEKTDLFRFILMGVFGIFLYFIFENSAVNLISASLASLLIAILPALSIVGDLIVLKKPITRNKALSVIVSILGAFLVAGFNTEESSKNLILGVILIFLSLVSWLIYSYVAAPLQNKYSTIKITFYQSLFGTVFFMFCLPFVKIATGTPNAVIISHLIFLGVICSALCYLLYNYSLKHIDVTVCSVFINLMPIVTVIASVIVLKERLTVAQFIGSALIIAAVFIATKPEK